jgi:hypothetical protein
VETFAQECLCAFRFAAMAAELAQLVKRRGDSWHPPCILPKFPTLFIEGLGLIPIVRQASQVSQPIQGIGHAVRQTVLLAEAVSLFKYPFGFGVATAVVGYHAKITNERDGVHGISQILIP